jgi:hypothetical protein
VGVSLIVMRKNFLALAGIAALMTACGGTLTAQTVAEVFTQFPGNHAIINNASIDMDVPLAGDDSVAIVGNPNVFKVNGQAITGQVGSFVNPSSTVAANAKVNGTTLGYVLHVTKISRDAFKTILNAVCTSDGAGGCTNSAGAIAKVFVKVGNTVIVTPGSIALRARKVGSNLARGGANASFQTATQVTLEGFNTGSLAVADGDIIFLMDLNSAAKIANPPPLVP